MSIKYRKGSLFDAAGTGVILTHACNARGVWGSGIAAEFARRYPMANRQYYMICGQAMMLRSVPSPIVGTAFICDDADKIGCLVTSYKFGAQVDPPELILQYTKTAVHQLLGLTEADIHSNKFNSGLFNVPWPETEAVLASVLADFPNRTWTVWAPH